MTLTINKKTYEAGELVAYVEKLEQENSELQQKWLEESFEKSKVEHNQEVISFLQKENAELKEKLKPEKCLKLLAKDGYVKFASDQLTKAKEIIKDQKELLDRVLSGAETLSDFAQNTLLKAEQFLKDSEVEK